MNVFQRKALAKAFGLSVSDLATMVSAQEKLNNMTDTELDQHKANARVTSNIQKIWGGIVKIFRDLSVKYVSRISKALMKILGIGGDIGKEMGNTDGIVKSISEWLDPIVDKFTRWLEDFDVKTAKAQFISIKDTVTWVVDKLIEGAKWLKEHTGLIKVMVGLWAANKLGLLDFAGSATMAVGKLILKLGKALIAKNLLDSSKSFKLVKGSKVVAKAGAKTAAKAGAKTAAKVGAKSVAKAGAKTAAKAGAKTAAKVGAKSVAKAGAKGLGKAALKKIPGIGLLVGLGFAADRLLKGDALGALGEVASGAAAIIPGLGTAASVAIDAALMAKDVSAASKDANDVAAEVAAEAKGAVDTSVATVGSAVVDPNIQASNDMVKEIKNLENTSLAGMPEFETARIEEKLDKIVAALSVDGAIAQANRTTKDELYQLGQP